MVGHCADRVDCDPASAQLVVKLPPERSREAPASGLEPSTRRRASPSRAATGSPVPPSRDCSRPWMCGYETASRPSGSRLTGSGSVSSPRKSRSPSPRKAMNHQSAASALDELARVEGAEGAGRICDRALRRRCKGRGDWRPRRRMSRCDRRRGARCARSSGLRPGRRPGCRSARRREQAAVLLPGRSRPGRSAEAAPPSRRGRRERAWATTPAASGLPSGDLAVIRQWNEASSGCRKSQGSRQDWSRQRALGRAGRTSVRRLRAPGSGVLLPVEEVVGDGEADALDQASARSG